MNTVTKSKKATINRMNAKVGYVFSEESHYIRRRTGRFTHLESGDEVAIADEYMEYYFKSADQFTEEVEVGKEDKLWTEKQLKEEGKVGGTLRVGDVRVKGIRSIWADIHSGMVFTVNFDKQSDEMSESAYEKAKDKQLEDAISEIVIAFETKKGVKAAALRAIQKIQDNPIERITKGAERTLRGYKIQFSSIN